MAAGSCRILPWPCRKIIERLEKIRISCLQKTRNGHLQKGIPHCIVKIHYMTEEFAIEKIK